MQTHLRAREETKQVITASGKDHSRSFKPNICLSKLKEVKDE